MFINNNVIVRDNKLNRRSGVDITPLSRLKMFYDAKITVLKAIDAKN